ncbi:MAG: fatty acid--CoA ligase family protein, partial [Bacteroidota bacterium]
ERLGPNQPGQLVIRGGTVMRGYWKKPEKTAEKLKDGPLPGEKVLYTGDRCMVDEDGYLYFLGRMDQMIKSRGVKVSPKETEDHLYQHPMVKDAAVMGVPHPEFGEALFAYVTLVPDGTATPIDLRTHCKSGLETYSVPEWIEILPAFPLTPNGKFNYLALREQAHAKTSGAARALSDPNVVVQ